MRVTIAALLILALPADALAAGGGGHEPPKQTQTTKDCFKEVQWDPSIQKWVKYSQPVNGVWDPRIEKCVRPDRASSLDADTALGAVRELAYAGRQIEAQQVLAGMADQSDPLVLTYWGFTHRKLGDLETAMIFYNRAIERDPDNMLARSYMGQGLVAAGDIDDARIQMAEIEARGGGYTWAGTSLRRAIYTGETFDY